MLSLSVYGDPPLCEDDSECGDFVLFASSSASCPGSNSRLMIRLALKLLVEESANSRCKAEIDRERGAGNSDGFKLELRSIITAMNLSSNVLTRLSLSGSCKMLNISAELKAFCRTAHEVFTLDATFCRPKKALTVLARFSMQTSLSLIICSAWGF